MRYSIFLLSLVIFLGCNHTEEKFHFRKVRWGMTKKMIRASESWITYSSLSRQPDEDLVYNGELFDKDTTLTYRFRPNPDKKGEYVLFMAVYNTKTSRNTRAKVYKDFVAALASKYGPGTTRKGDNDKDIGVTWTPPDEETIIVLGLTKFGDVSLIYTDLKYILKKPELERIEKQRLYEKTKKNL